MHPHRTRIIISLIVAILAIAIIPHTEILAEYMVWAYGGVALLLAAYAAVKKHWFDVALGIFIGGTIILGRLYFSEVREATYLLRATSILAYMLLSGALLIGPWSRFSDGVRKLYKHRRHVGVATFLLAETHAGIIIDTYFSYNFELIYSASFIFFGSTALFIMFFLAMTSWDWAQKKLKKLWKYIHPAVLLAYIGYMLYAWEQARDLELWHQIVHVGFILFWLLVAPWSLPKKILRRVNGWKQLHVLVYIAYISMVIHAWEAIVSTQDVWLQVVYWIPVVIVTGSHIIGLLRLAKQHKVNKAPREMITHDGQEYFFAIEADKLTNGKGTRVVVNDMPIAVFKHNESYFGIAAICPHQGGPLADGEIVNGYVECPWHQYQFGVEDGQGPPEFDDCVPYHKALEQHGKIFVAMESTEACDDY